MKIHDKLDVIQGHLAKIDVTLAEQAQCLKEHMRRTELNEDAIEILREELKPLTGVKFFFKFVGILSVFLGVIMGIYKLIKLL